MQSRTREMLIAWYQHYMNPTNIVYSAHKIVDDLDEFLERNRLEIVPKKNMPVQPIEKDDKIEPPSVEEILDVVLGSRDPNLHDQTLLESV